MGDLPTVFITLQKDGHTWVPNTGDTIDLDTEVGHPLLELMTDNAQADQTKSAEERLEITESPEAADESKEN
jgi:hypothetical protein